MTRLLVIAWANHIRHCGEDRLHALSPLIVDLSVLGIRGWKDNVAVIGIGDIAKMQNEIDGCAVRADVGQLFDQFHCVCRMRDSEVSVQQNVCWRTRGAVVGEVSRNK